MSKVKLTPKVQKKICDLIKADTYTIAEICANVGISDRCFYQWQANDADFSESIARAKEEALKVYAREAKKSLMKKLTGYDYVETKTVYVDSGIKGDNKPKIKESIKVTKHVQADTQAIIFTLINQDGESWKNRQTTELTGKDGKDLFAAMTDEELDAKIADLESKMKK